MRSHEVLRTIAPLRVALAAIFLLGAAVTARATGPESVANLAEKLSPAVVNISTTQKSDGVASQVPIPDLPEGSPFKDFFDEFFEKQQREGGEQPRRMNSLGSGFVVDAVGLHRHQQPRHRGRRGDRGQLSPTARSSRPTVVGKDDKTDLAVLKVEAAKPLPAVEFGDSRRLRVGDWVMAIGNPFGLGGSVTARHRLGAQPRHQCRSL